MQTIAAEDDKRVENESGSRLQDVLNCRARVMTAHTEQFQALLSNFAETAMGVKINAQKNSDSTYVRAVYALGASFLQVSHIILCKTFELRYKISQIR